jgi:sortase A
VVGVLGELLITLGALVGLFVVWQVWWTDVEVRGVQSDLVATVERPSGDDPTRAPSPSAQAPTPERRSAPPVLEPPESIGTTFASLRVPRWGAEYVMPISEGVSRSAVLDTLGIGHYPGTAMPGAVGNFALAGHRVGFGRPFFGVAELEVGDPLVVRTSDSWYVYEVTSSRVVPPSDVTVLAPVPGRPGVEAQAATITLTTCHPLFSTRERYVVHGTLDHWLAASDGTPAVLGGHPEARAAITPTSTRPTARGT